MGADDIATLLVAITGLAALLFGHMQNKQGHRVQQVQQRTANTLQGQAQEFTQQQQIIVELREEIVRKDRGHAADMTRCTEVRAELAATLSLLSEVVRDEVAKSMASMAIEKSERHTETDH